MITTIKNNSIRKTLTTIAVLLTGLLAVASIAPAAASADTFRYDKTGTQCSGGPQAGPTALREWLNANGFRDGAFLGIYNCRPVRGGATLSMHGEGRALDWGYNANTAAGLARGNALRDTLLANGADLARRMGVQEIIWNRQIWTSNYPQSGMRPYSGTSPHTDHLHIGMNWPGARKQTSFWQ